MQQHDPVDLETHFGASDVQVEGYWKGMANLYLIIFALLVLPALGYRRYLIGDGPDFVSISVLVNVSMLSLPAILLVPRVIRRYRRGSALISDEFARAKTVGLGVGKLFVWIATIGILMSLVAIAVVLVSRQTGVLAGLGIGLSMWPLAVGILAIEVSYRRWAKKRMKDCS
jgi:hypothetical protein